MTQDDQDTSFELATGLALSGVYALLIFHGVIFITPVVGSKCANTELNRDVR